MIKSTSPFTKSITAIFLHPIPQPRVNYLTTKKYLDLVISLFALLLLTPLLLVVAGLIKADSKGPVFFTQKRIGKEGQVFTLYKFRSMHSHCQSNESLQKMQPSDRKGACAKFINDPRVTRVGRLLRKFSIDEIPQLFNVLKREMSLVGPRPALPLEVENYDYRDRKRLAVIPGITGLWQISGRANLSFYEQIELDLSYIEHANFMLDLKIMLLTVPAILSCKGAY